MQIVSDIPRATRSSDGDTGNTRARIYFSLAAVDNAPAGDFKVTIELQGIIPDLQRGQCGEGAAIDPERLGRIGVDPSVTFDGKTLPAGNRRRCAEQRRNRRIRQEIATTDELKRSGVEEQAVQTRHRIE